MSIKYREMVKGALLTGSPVSLYTTPALSSAVIHAVSINNPTGAAVTFDIYKVPTGSAADATTKIDSRVIPALSVLPANNAINHKLETGTQIYASGAGLTLNISGVEYIPDS